MNMKSRIKAIGMLLAICMVFTLMPATAFAESSTGSDDRTGESGIKTFAAMEYTEYTIVGWKNEGPEGAIKSVSIKGAELPETGGTITASPSELLEVSIVMNPGYKVGQWLDGVILRFGGIQSGSNNVSNSSSAVSIKAPSSEWLSGVWGPDDTDHEIYLIIPTEEDESAVKYTLSFETNGGSDISPVSKFDGSVISLADYTTSRSGYTFDGWYVDKALTEKITSVTLDKNMTVYAKWTKGSGDGGTAGGGSSSDKTTPASPQTGDDSSTTLWIVLACISLLGMAAAIFGRKRFNE